MIDDSTTEICELSGMNYLPLLTYRETGEGSGDGLRCLHLHGLDLRLSHFDPGCLNDMHLWLISLSDHGDLRLLGNRESLDR